MKKIDEPLIDNSVLAGLEPLSRRRFLRLGLTASTAASAVVITGCASFTGAKVQAPAKPSSIRHLSSTEYQVLHKLTLILLPTDNDPDLPSSITEVPVLSNIDTMIGKMPSDVRKLFGLGVKGFDYGALGLSLKFKRFSNMNDQQAQDYVNDWQNGAFLQRGLMTSLKSVVCLNYWRDERTWDALDYDGPVTEKWGIRRLGNASLPIA